MRQQDPIAHLGDAQRLEFARAKRVARWVGVYVPLAIILFAAVLLVIWLPRMPDPVTRQWDFSGEPSSFGPTWTNIALSVGIGLGILVLFAVAPSLEARKAGTPTWGWPHRLIPAMALGAILLIQLGALTTAWVQLDLADAADAPPIGTAMLVNLGVAILAGAIGWFVQPKLRIAAAKDSALGIEPVALPESVSAVWTGMARPGKSFLWFMVLSLVLMVFFPVLELSQPQPDLVFVWIMLGCFLLVAALLFTNLWFRVRIDKRGLEARAPLGWPAYRVPADDIESVKVAQVHPFGEFGGWGVRVGPDRFGIVMRTGEGVVIERRSRARSFTITVDSAQSAASLLEAVGQGMAR